MQKKGRVEIWSLESLPDGESLKQLEWQSAAEIKSLWKSFINTELRLLGGILCPSRMSMPEKLRLLKRRRKYRAKVHAQTTFTLPPCSWQSPLKLAACTPDAFTVVGVSLHWMVKGLAGAAWKTHDYNMMRSQGGGRGCAPLRVYVSPSPDLCVWSKGRGTRVSWEIQHNTEMRRMSSRVQGCSCPRDCQQLGRRWTLSVGLMKGKWRYSRKA